MRDDGSEVIELPQARPGLVLHPTAIGELDAGAGDREPDVKPDIRAWIAKLEGKRDTTPHNPEGEAQSPQPAPVVGTETATSFENLTPLPAAADPYVAHSRIFSFPLPTLFLLPSGQLPYGLAYPNLEDVWMADSLKPGGSPDLMMLVNGLRPKEVRVEGHPLLSLCDYIGRHLIHWVREYPGGKEPFATGVFIRRITIRPVQG